MVSTFNLLSQIQKSEKALCTNIQNLTLLVAGYDHFYCQVSFKNIYICMVYTIFADYIFPCKWLSVSITGFKRNYFVYLRFFFLVHLIKKEALYMTLLETSRHNLTLNRLLQYSQYVIYFCIAEKHVLMKCLLIYLDTERAFTECRI